MCFISSLSCAIATMNQITRLPTPSFFSLVVQCLFKFCVYVSFSKFVFSQYENFPCAQIYMPSLFHLNERIFPEFKIWQETFGISNENLSKVLNHIQLIDLFYNISHNYNQIFEVISKLFFYMILILLYHYFYATHYFTILFITQKSLTTSTLILPIFFIYPNGQFEVPM